MLQNTKFVKVFEQIYPYLVSVFSNRLKTWKGSGFLEDVQTAVTRQLLKVNPATVANVGELVTGERRPPSDMSERGFVRMGHTKISWLCRTASHHIHLTSHQPTFHHAVQKNYLKLFSERQGHREKPNRWIKCIVFGLLQWLFCGKFRKLQARERILNYIITTASFYLVVFVLIGRIPQCNCLTTYCIQIHCSSVIFCCWFR
jgi:hypothetical protein